MKANLTRYQYKRFCAADCESVQSEVVRAWDKTDAVIEGEFYCCTEDFCTDYNSTDDQYDYDVENTTGYDVDNTTGYDIGSTTGYAIGNTTGRYDIGNTTGYAIGNTTGYDVSATNNSSSSDTIFKKVSNVETESELSNENDIEV